MSSVSTSASAPARPPPPYIAEMSAVVSRVASGEMSVPEAGAALEAVRARIAAGPRPLEPAVQVLLDQLGAFLDAGVEPEETAT
jgi:hypothetical protein